MVSVDRIVYVGTSGDLFTIKADGTDTQQLTGNTQVGSDPARPMEPADPPESGARQIPAAFLGQTLNFSQFYAWPTWSPDGTKLAVSRVQVLIEREVTVSIQIIDAMVNDRGTHLQLNIPNNGTIQSIPDDVLVEIPVVVDGRGIHNEPVDELPPLIVNNVLLPRLSRMENLHDAFLRGDRRPLLLSLMDDPRTATFEQARDLIDDILAQPWNKEADEHYRQVV